MRVGIFGGSFNPIHLGHLKLAQAALVGLGLSKIYFVPTFLTPLKNNQDQLPAATRAKLVRLAIQDNPRFALSLCEVKRKGLSFTVDTLEYFKKKLGSETTLYFLTGADSLENLSKWKSLEKIFKLCRLVVASRPGFEFKNNSRSIIYLPFKAEDVSSSQIRERIAKKRSIKKLVPKSIIQELKKGVASSKLVKK